MIFSGPDQYPEPTFQLVPVPDPEPTFQLVSVPDPDPV
jgi:hypothetical protein